MATKPRTSMAVLIAGTLIFIANSCRCLALPQTSDLCHTDHASQTDSAPSTLSNYQEIRTYTELMFLYYSTSLEAPNYATMANVFSKEYRSEVNTFRRAELLEKLKPRLDAGICAVDRSQYFTVRMPADATLFSHYDLPAKAFHVPVIRFPCSNVFVKQPDFCRADPGSTGFYDLQFTNDDDFSLFPIADERVARQIEDLVSKKVPPRLQIYAVTQTTGENHTSLITVQVVKSRIMAMSLLDAAGHVLATELAKSDSGR
jgi:hypothetical protein